MSLTLTNRLDKLENEIRIMLMLQKCGYQQMSHGATITTKQDGNVKYVEIQARAAVGPKSEDGFKLSGKNPLKCPTECTKRPSRETSNLPRPIKHPSHGCCCVTCKTEPCVRKIPSPDPLCKCGKDPVKEVEIEKDRRVSMEAEVNRLKVQIADMMQSKCMALNMTKQLKQRYEKMKTSHEDTNTKMASLQRENEFLCRCLEKERQALKEKAEAGAQVSKDIDKQAFRKLKEQYAKIKSLNDSVQNLSKTVEDKDFEKKRIENEKEKIHEKLKRNKDVTKRLSETNAKLAKSVRQKHDSFMAIRNKAGKYQKELSEYKDEVRRSQMELFKLKVEIEKQKSKGDSLIATSMTPASRGKDAEGLEDKLKKTKDKERRASETVQLLSQRIRYLESKNPKGLEKELQRVSKDSKVMQIKYEDAVNKMKQLEEADQKRAEMIKNEMKTFTDEMTKREEAYLEEKEKLKALIEELQSIIDGQRTRIDELEAMKDQQDVVIKSQNEQLISKEEQIRLRETENDLVKEQCLDLDKQVDNLRTSMDHFENIGAKATQIELRERIKLLSDEMNGLKSALADEQAKSHTKDKVIEDQYNTIQQLKAKLGQQDADLKALSRESRLQAQMSQDKIERMSRQLAKEQEITKSTVTNLKSMEKKKMKLERNVEDLEEAYEELSSVSLSERLNKEQKRWDEERMKLVEERDRAIGAAKLATKTLMETMDDFQGQIKSQQKLQKIVTEIISSKSLQNFPPCMKRREMDRARQLQVAIPCKPVMPRCNFRSSDEDGFYTASSSKYLSDSENSTDAAPASGMFNMLSIPRYSNYLAALPKPDVSMIGQSIYMPPPSRNLTAPLVQKCRCTNTQNQQCQCSQNRSSIPLPVAEQSRQNMKNSCCYKGQPQTR